MRTAFVLHLFCICICSCSCMHPVCMNCNSSSGTCIDFMIGLQRSRDSHELE